MTSTLPKLGILGAGKLGTVLAQLALKAGYNVAIAGSGDSAKIALSMRVLAPGAQINTAEEVARSSDVIILALPLHNYRQLPVAALTGKVVIDAMNYWWEVDGSDETLRISTRSTSELVQEFLPNSRVVKALSHMGYHHLLDEAKSADTPERKAIAVAGDNAGAISAASSLVENLGFDPLTIGPLQNGRRLEPGYPAFGANVLIAELERLIATPTDNKVH